MDKKTGMEKVKAICEDRSARVKELKEQGHKVIGYLCNFAPPEIISAAGMVPYRITGRMDDEIIEANNYVEPFGCPYVRNCFEQSLKGRVDFVDGVVIPHSCDMVQRIYGFWKYYQKPDYSYMFNTPHQVNPWSCDFFERETSFFKESLEKYTGKEIAEEKVLEAIQLYNENRRIIKDLYDLRKQNPPYLTGVEMFYILLAGVSIPADEYNLLLKEVLAEIKSRPRGNQDNRPRVMIWGCVIDDARLYEIVEDMGAYVVTDDTCIGTRTNLREVDTSQGVLKGLMQMYYKDFMCPQTDRGPWLKHFDYVLDLIRDFNVQGVIGYRMAFCDLHDFDYPDLRDYLDKKGIPMLLIDDDYSLGTIEAVKNRVQAFLEMLR